MDEISEASEHEEKLTRSYGIMQEMLSVELATISNDIKEFKKREL